MKNEIDKSGKRELTMQERFTNSVLNQLTGSMNGGEITQYQKRLVNGYFISIDKTLSKAEEDRLRKNESNSDKKWNNNLAYTWSNVNLQELSIAIMHYAKMGLDMMQDNHLFPIPYKDKSGENYVVNLMLGYNGIQYIAEEYAVEKPENVTIELVYSNDEFNQIKKDSNHSVESYEFNVKSPFNRGEIVGGFGYIEYENALKNKLITMSLSDIEKRKPERASANFWGGTIKGYEKGKQVEKETSGWFPEMCLKTIKREVYSAKNMPRDPKKIDEAYHQMRIQEIRFAQLESSMYDEEPEIVTVSDNIFLDNNPENERQIQTQKVDDEGKSETQKVDDKKEIQKNSKPQKQQTIDITTPDF
jgi:recombination protein RecT